jgi:hypothetical protein
LPILSASYAKLRGCDRSLVRHNAGDVGEFMLLSRHFREIFMEFIEEYRWRALDNLFRLKAFEKAWKTWGPEASALTDGFKDASKVFGLGNHLSDLFRSTASAGRSQSTLSVAGGSWEALVTWYLNVVLSGTNGVATKQLRALVPTPISNALSINYGSEPTNTESDVIGLVLPEHIAGKNVAGEKFKKVLDTLVAPALHEISVVTIQCKTNWNDNAQIPMLWDLVYSSTGFKGSNMTIGIEGRSVKDLAEFRYAFVTVPSQKAAIKPNTMPVRRVSSLSGGNYWGQPTVSGVASGLPEIFKRSFGAAFDGTVTSSIQRAIDKKLGWFDYMASLEG